jgi:hypothetical protein
VFKGKIKGDFTRRTSSPVRNGTATTKPEKYDEKALLKSVYLENATQRYSDYLKIPAISSNFHYEPGNHFSPLPTI